MLDKTFFSLEDSETCTYLFTQEAQDGRISLSWDNDQKQSRGMGAVILVATGGGGEGSRFNQWKKKHIENVLQWPGVFTVCVMGGGGGVTVQLKKKTKTTKN